jgi:hypothetical protein
MADWYVDADSGADGNSGVDWANAKEHVSAVFTAMAFPITSSTTIYLKEGTTADYTEASNSNYLSLNGVRCVGNGHIYIQGENWNSGNYYTGSGSPVGGGGGFDPTEDKPITLAFAIDIARSDNITIRGVAINDETENTPSGRVGLHVRDSSTNIQLHYSTVELFYFGVLSNNDSALYVFNSYIMDNTMGGSSVYGARLYFLGDNYIYDSVRKGVYAYMNATIGFYPWPGEQMDVFTTKIYTDVPRKDYVAIEAAVNSTIDVKTDEVALQNPDYALLKIINELATREKQMSAYVGVSLKTRSTLSGAGNILFAESTVAEGLDTVPAAQQITSDSSGVLLID